MPPVPTSYWIRNERGEIRGPMTVDALKVLHRDGKLGGRVQASRDGVAFASPALFPEVGEILPESAWLPGEFKAPPRPPAQQPAARPPGPPPTVGPPKPGAGPAIVSSRTIHEAPFVSPPRPAPPAPRQATPSPGAAQPAPARPAPPEAAPAAKPPVDEGAIPASGDLADFPPLHLYYLVGTSNAGGKLTLRGPRATYEIFFKRGAPEAVRSNLPEEDLSAFLVGKGVVRKEQIEDAKKVAEGFGGEVINALFGLQLINPADAFQGIAEHSVLLLERALGLARGRFEFDPASKPPATAMPLGDRWGLCCNAARAIEGGEIRDRFGKRMKLPILRSGGRLDPGQLKLNPHERRASLYFDGARSLEQIFEAYPADADVTIHLAYLGWNCRLLTFQGDDRLARDYSPPPVSAPTPPPLAAPLPEPAAAQARPPASPPPAASTPAQQRQVITAPSPQPPAPQHRQPASPPAAPAPAPQQRQPASPPAAAASPAPQQRQPTSPPQAAAPAPLQRQPTSPPAAAASPQPRQPTAPPEVAAAPQQRPSASPPAATPTPLPRQKTAPPSAPGAHPAPAVKPLPRQQTSPPHSKEQAALAAAANDLAQLKALREELPKKNHFELLGVPENVTTAQVKTAYFQLAKTYHPDTLPQGASAELAKLRSDIFAAIGEAHRVLSDDKLREEYARSLKEGGELVDAMAILNAEESFQKACILIKARKYPEAVAMLEEAVKLNETEGEFWSWLGWARYLMAADKAAAKPDALRDIEHGIKLNPKCANSFYFAGAIAKLSGDLATAKNFFKKAVEADPKHVDALRELRLAASRK